MGRPRIHDDTTRDELLAAAELLIAERGIDAVTVRDVARKAGTTTRAVYVLFGSKEQLLEALARRGFELLMSGIAAVPPSSDPARDLVNRSVRGFRPFALEHPDLFRLFFTPQRSTAMAGRAATASRLTAYGQLVALVERVQRTGLLGSVSVEEATMLWDALCTGLALREICGPINGRRVTGSGPRRSKRYSGASGRNLRRKALVAARRPWPDRPSSGAPDGCWTRDFNLHHPDRGARRVAGRC